MSLFVCKAPCKSNKGVPEHNRPSGSNGDASKPCMFYPDGSMRCYRKYCAPCRAALASTDLVTPQPKRQRIEEVSTPTKEPMSGSEESDDSYLADTRQNQESAGVVKFGWLFMQYPPIPAYVS